MASNGNDYGFVYVEPRARCLTPAVKSSKQYVYVVVVPQEDCGVVGE